MTTGVSSKAMDGSQSVPSATPLWRYALVTGVGLALYLGIIVGVSLAFGYASVHIPPWMLEADSALYRSINGLSDLRLTRLIFLFFNDPGVDYSVPIAACLAYVWFGRRRDMLGAAAAFALTLVVGAWTMQFTQAFGFRPRPFILIPDALVDPTWKQVWTYLPTFPSGHIRELTGVSLVLAYFWRRALWPAAAYTAFIAFSRIYIGAHYPTDVAAGVAIGLLDAGFALVAVSRLTILARSLAGVPAVRSAYTYVTGRGGEAVADPLRARLLRGALALAALLAVTAALGYVVHIQEPRVLADYLRNTDSSLVFPLLRLFAPRRLSWVLYWAFAAGITAYPALAALILGRAARRGRRYLLLAGDALAAAAFVVLLIGALIAPQFERVRPFMDGGGVGLTLPPEWATLWPGPAAFPDPHLLLITALCTILAAVWPRLRAPAYAYAFFAMLVLFYFGAAWPIGTVVTLLCGYWTGKYALFLARQFAPRPA